MKTKLMIMIMSLVFMVPSLKAEDKMLERAKEKYQKDVERADADLEKAQAKRDADEVKAKSTLVKVYEFTIKKYTRRRKLEIANKLLEEKEAFAGGEEVRRDEEVSSLDSRVVKFAHKHLRSYSGHPQGEFFYDDKSIHKFGSYGMLIVVASKSGKLTRSKFYNTRADGFSSEKILKEFKKIKSSEFVVVHVWGQNGETMKYINKDVVSKFKSFGAEESTFRPESLGNNREDYVNYFLVGKKGLKSGKAIELFGGSIKFP